MQLTTSFFGGNGSFKAMLAAVGVALVPPTTGSFFLILTSATQVALGFENVASGAVGILGGALSFGFWVWHVVLVVIGAAKARGVGYGESSGSCAGCATLIIVVGLVFGVAVTAFAGA